MQQNLVTMGIGFKIWRISHTGISSDGLRNETPVSRCYQGTNLVKSTNETIFKASMFILLCTYTILHKIVVSLAQLYTFGSLAKKNDEQLFLLVETDDICYMKFISLHVIVY